MALTGLYNYSKELGQPYNSNYWKDIYNKLGAPYGPYKGTYQQNIWLEKTVRDAGGPGKIGSGTPAQGQPTAAPQEPVKPGLADSIVEGVGGKKVYTGPIFSEVMPLDKVWDQMMPTVQAEGEAMINPFIQRDLNASTKQYDLGAAGSGGWRYGRGGLGKLGAEAERNKKEQLLNWINTRRQGFIDLFYKPTEEAWNKTALETGTQPNAPSIPTWEELKKKFNF